MANIKNRPCANGKSAWRVQIRKKGHPYIQKTFKTEIEAKTWAAEIESGIDLSRKQEHFTIPKLPLKIWIERYKHDILPFKVNGKKEFYFLEFWNKHLGGEIAVEISSHAIESMLLELTKIKTRLGTGLSSETIIKYFMYLGQLYNIAIKTWKWATYNPITGVQVHRNLKSEHKQRKSFLKDKDVEFVNEWRSNYIKLIEKSIGEKEFSLRSLSRESGMTLHTIQSGICKDCNPTLKYILKLTKALGLKVTVSIDE